MGQREEIINKAQSQLGYKEGQNNYTKYGEWYGIPNGAWCAMFISWCAYECGIGEDIIPKFAGCITGFNQMTKMGITTKQHITPQPGDLIFFEWDGEKGDIDHVGIVESVSGETVNTIEGNRSNAVGRYKYNKNDWRIVGYAIPRYLNEDTPTPPTEVIETIKVDTPSGLNIRAGASTDYAILGAYPNGTTLDIYEITGNWGRTKDGWVCLNYTTHTEGNPNSGYVLGLYVVNTPSGLNVRAGAGTNYDIIKAYPNGTRFDTYEIDGNWARTPSGWVCLDYCDLVYAY